MEPKIAPTGPILDARDYRRRFPDGRIGSDPSLANPEAGERLFKGAVEDLAKDYTEFLDADGTWLPREERARRMQDVLGEDRAVAWSVMCGSGVTACHLAISGLEAGYSEPRVYVGSWSEWIRDPERPIGLGNRA